jgi:outer membrane murein-binding lipoprotein Lpp
MPRKKASEVTAASSPGRIPCPACKSEISADGATLYARSTYLDELIETDAGVERLEKLVEQLESKLAAAKEELQRVKTEAEPKSKPEVRTNETVGSETGKQRGGWW